MNDESCLNGIDFLRNGPLRMRGYKPCSPFLSHHPSFHSLTSHATYGYPNITNNTNCTVKRLQKPFVFSLECQVFYVAKGCHYAIVDDECYYI